PLAGVIVRVTAYRDSCTGPEILLLPSPRDTRTDSAGVYVAPAEVTQSASSACVRVAYSDALYADTNGVALHAPPALPETLHVNVTGPRESPTFPPPPPSAPCHPATTGF